TRARSECRPITRLLAVSQACQGQGFSGGATFKVQGSRCKVRRESCTLHPELCTLHLSYQESFRELVVRVDPMLGPAYQVRPALHFRDHRGVRAAGGAADHPAGEPAADDALDDDWLPDPDLPPSEMDGEAPAHAGSGR